MVRAFILAVVALLATSCSLFGGGSPGAAVPATKVTSESDQGLRVEFLGRVMPVTGEEELLGFQTYDVPLYNAVFRRAGICLVDAGFTTLGEGLAATRVPVDNYYLPLLWYLPFLDSIRATDSEADDDMSFVYVLNGIPNGDGPVDPEFRAQGIAGIASEISDRDWGVDPSDAEAIFDTLANCGVYDASVVDLLAAAGLRLEQWRQSLESIDEEPEVTPALAEALACIRELGPEFVDVQNREDFLAALEVAKLASGHPQSFWSPFWNGYADCMEVLEAARVPFRQQLRRDLVEKDYASLLEFQSKLDEAVGR